MDFLFFLWLKLGPILNFAGTIMIAFSFEKNPGEAGQIVNGRRVYLASVLHPRMFRAGFFLLAGGFLLNLVFN